MSDKISNPELRALEQELDDAEAKCERLVEQKADLDDIQAALEDYNRSESKVNDYILTHVDELKDET